MKPLGYIVLTIKFKQEGKKWVAYCEELGTSTYGRSLNEAKERIQEAVFLHLNTLEDLGERERFFKEHNIRLVENKPKDSELKLRGPFDSKTYSVPYVYPIEKELSQH